MSVDLAGDIALQDADDLALGAPLLHSALEIGLRVWVVGERTMTMRHNALLAWRSPPRLSRWRVTLPEDAWIGDTPQRWAQAASERSRSGLSPAVMSREAAVSGPTPLRASRSGATGEEEGSDELVEAGDLDVEGPDSMGQARDRGFRPRSDRIEERVGRSDAASATRAGIVSPFSRHRSWSGAL